MNAPLQARWVQTGAEVAGAIVIPSEANGRLIVPEYAAPDPWLLETAGIGPDPIFRSAQKPSYAIYELPEDPAVLLLNQKVDFEGKIILVGYDTLLAPDRGSIQLITVWKMEEALPDDVAIFAHLKNEEGELISQHDGFDAAPGTLISGDLLVQRHVLPLKEPFPVGAHTLHIGLYRRGDGQRFKLVDDSIEPADQIVFPFNLSLSE
jgi:hypothetical protein